MTTRTDVVSDDGRIAQLDLPSPATTIHPSIDELLDTVTHSLHLDSFIPDATHQRLALLVTVLLLLLSVLLVLRLLSRPSSRGDTILIAGPLSSGKTLLFFQLLQGRARPTHTSMMANSAVFTPSLAPSLPPLRYYDLPGHPSQSHTLAPLLGSLRGVIVVLDSAALSLQRLPATCALLHSFLERELLQQRRTRVLVLCNAREGETGEITDAAQAKRMLEEGVQRRRLLTAKGGGVGSMQDLGGEVEGRGLRPVGVEGKPFTMEDSAMGVTVATGNAMKGELSAVAQWLTHFQ